MCERQRWLADQTKITFSHNMAMDLCLWRYCWCAISQIWLALAQVGRHGKLDSESPMLVCECACVCVHADEILVLPRLLSCYVRACLALFCFLQHALEQNTMSCWRYVLCVCVCVCAYDCKCFLSLEACLTNIKVLFLTWITIKQAT